MYLFKSPKMICVSIKKEKEKVLTTYKGRASVVKDATALPGDQSLPSSQHPHRTVHNSLELQLQEF